jgi:acrylyl-CoA reductase (NADPH)
MQPLERREQAWRQIAADLPPAILDEMTREVSLAEVPDLARQILRGQIQGRVVVDVNA